MNGEIRLSDLKKGESGRVIRVGGEEKQRRRIIDMGVTTGVVVTMKRIAPFGDPIEITVRGYALSIRKEQAQEIWTQRS